MPSLWHAPVTLSGRRPASGEPGGWPVINRADTEFTYILSGVALLTDEASGRVVEVTGGDLIILPPGWSGRWDVIKKVRKVYAIY